MFARHLGHLGRSSSKFQGPLCRCRISKSLRSPLAAFNIDDAVQSAKQLIQQRTRGEILRWVDDVSQKARHALQRSGTYSYQLAAARSLVRDSAVGDARTLKQAIKVLLETSSETERRLRAGPSADPLPTALFTEFSNTAEEITAGLMSVWSRYCASDLPGVLQSLSTVWSSSADTSCAPIRWYAHF